MFGSTDMTFGTVGHNLHRQRRGAFNAFFSKASIRRLEPLIRYLVNTLCERLAETKNTGKPVNIIHAYSALTQDIISEYCFADCRNVLHMDDFSPWYYNLVQKPSELTQMWGPFFKIFLISLPAYSYLPIYHNHTAYMFARIKQFPLMLPILDLLPNWWINATSPLVAQLRAQRAGYEAQVKSILLDSSSSESSHQTVFHSLRNDPDLPPSEKSVPRLVMEAQSLIGAGTLTSTHMLSTTTYFVLSDPTVLSHLLDELESVIPDPLDIPMWQNLEQLPYLIAVIYEGLRLSYGVMHRLQRVYPLNSLQYREWTIPPGAPVGMSSPFMHNNPDIFPEPRTFDPSRWLGPEGKERQKYLFNFGRGTRMCVGINLAYAEFYITLATVFRRFGRRQMRLFETQRERR